MKLYGIWKDHITRLCFKLDSKILTILAYEVPDMGKNGEMLKKKEVLWSAFYFQD